MKDFFKELFEYNNKYNEELLTIIIAHPRWVSEKSFKLINHILNAHHIWNRRITGLPPSFKVWDTNAAEELMEINANNYENTLRIIKSSNFATIIPYTSSYGGNYKNTVRDILYHTINHSTYHRGQIASDFKLNGIDPIVTDYISHKRISL